MRSHQPRYTSAGCCSASHTLSQPLDCLTGCEEVTGIEAYSNLSAKTYHWKQRNSYIQWTADAFLLWVSGRQFLTYAAFIIHQVDNIPQVFKLASHDILLPGHILQHHYHELGVLMGPIDCCLQQQLRSIQKSSTTGVCLMYDVMNRMANI